MSVAVAGMPMQANLAPSSINSSYIPGVNGSGKLTSPSSKVTKQVPQLPEVQFVEMSTPAIIACSTSVSPSSKWV
jgi:hypothetical protein